MACFSFVKLRDQGSSEENFLWLLHYMHNLEKLEREWDRGKNLRTWDSLSCTPSLMRLPLGMLGDKTPLFCFAQSWGSHNSVGKISLVIIRQKSLGGEPL